MCFSFSDIDLVVIGCWPTLPLWKLEQKLLENEIAEQHTIKVLDKASVRFIKRNICFFFLIKNLYSLLNFLFYIIGANN